MSGVKTTSWNNSGYSIMKETDTMALLDFCKHAKVNEHNKQIAVIKMLKERKHPFFNCLQKIKQLLH